MIDEKKYEPKFFKVPWGFWHCNMCNEEFDSQAKAESCYDTDVEDGYEWGFVDSPYQRWRKIMEMEK